MLMVLETENSNSVMGRGGGGLYARKMMPNGSWLFYCPVNFRYILKPVVAKLCKFLFCFSWCKNSDGGAVSRAEKP